ncbi:hypothetical protein D9M70_599020 [compost metagenome]
MPFGRNDPEQAVPFTLRIHLIGVVAAGVPSPQRHSHDHTVFAGVLLVEFQAHLAEQFVTGRIALENPAVD